MLLTGAMFTMLSHSTAEEVDGYNKQAIGASRSELEELKEQSIGYYDTSVLLYIVGGIVAAGGATMVLLNPSDTETAGATMRPSSSASGVGLGFDPTSRSWRLRWGGVF